MDEINRQLRECARIAFRAYEPRAYFGRVDLFLTKHRKIERLLREAIPLHGWHGIIRGPLQIHEVECGHFDLLQEPVVQGVAETTASCLRRASASTLQAAPEEIAASAGGATR
jgi:thioesterase domain-containing protein